MNNWVNWNSEKYEYERRKRLEGYTSRCFTCETITPLAELKGVSTWVYEEQYWLCNLCHLALWNGCKGDEVEMTKHLNKTRIERERTLEKNDRARKSNTVPVTIEDVLDLSWELTKNAKGWYENLLTSLEKKNEK